MRLSSPVAARVFSSRARLDAVNAPGHLEEIRLHVLNSDCLSIGKTLIAVDEGEGFDLKYGFEPFSMYPFTIFLRSASRVTIFRHLWAFRLILGQRKLEKPAG